MANVQINPAKTVTVEWQKHPDHDVCIAELGDLQLVLKWDLDKPGWEAVLWYMGGTKPPVEPLRKWSIEQDDITMHESAAKVNALDRVSDWLSYHTTLAEGLMDDDLPDGPTEANRRGDPDGHG